MSKAADLFWDAVYVVGRAQLRIAIRVMRKADRTLSKRYVRTTESGSPTQLRSAA